MITTLLALIRSLRGLTPRFGCLDDGRLDELQMGKHLSSNPALEMAAWFYWIRKMQARYFAGEHAAAADVSLNAQVWRQSSFWEAAESSFYGALACAAYWDFAPPDAKQRHFEALIAQHKQLDIWAQTCPETFENRAALVAAEIARIEGREPDAMRLYEKAIRAARDNGLVQNEALANELAARFYAARGLETSSHAHLRNARQGYLRWGADGKVRQLDQLHPRLRLDERVPSLTGTIEAPVEHLDLATVIKVSQAVSGDIVLEKLLETLMRTAIEQSGAVRGLLILSREAGPRITAEATTGDAIVVQLRDEPLTETSLPESVVHYVLRIRESVILDDAPSGGPFAADPYIRQRQARSLLCMPLLNQGQPIGVLYLENNLTPRVFTPARIAVLKLIAAQAAISLERNRLYREIAEREARIRRLVDSNIIGIFTWRVPASGDGVFEEVNDEFLRMLGYDREEFGPGRMRRSQLTPPEWWERDRRTLLELHESGVSHPIEKEYIRKDGSRIPVLMGSACFDETRTRGVSFVLDLSERRRAADALREMQAQLAHANRVETMGQLTASIAHEVNQPIAATKVNAQVALPWLNREAPDLEEVRQSLARIVNDSDRAANVVGRIRDLIKKAPPRGERVEINVVIREVIEITRSEALKYGVSVRAEFGEDLPAVDGDRVELQQVILNLIVNAVEAMKHMSEGPRDVLITTGKSEAGGILVAVCDSGPGLAPAIQENLFKAFHTTKPNGLGLGLSICRSIVETHGGRLWAAATAPRGTVFQFTLPSHLDHVSLG